MNVSLNSTSASTKSSSLLETGSAASQAEESSESKGFFESFKSALGLSDEGDKTIKSKAPSGQSSASESSEVSDSEGKPPSEAKGKVTAEGEAGKAEGSMTEDGAVAQAKTAGDKVAEKNEQLSGQTTAKSISATDTESESDSQAQLKSGNALQNSTTTSSNSAEAAVDSKEQVASNHQVKPQDEAAQQSERGSHSSVTSSAATANTAQPQAMASQASNAMNEGNKLLGQLDEANRTLQQPQNGKALPQTGDASSFTSTLQTPNAFSSNQLTQPITAGGATIPAASSTAQLSAVQPPVTQLSAAQLLAAQQPVTQLSGASLNAATQANTGPAGFVGGETAVGTATTGLGVSSLNSEQQVLLTPPTDPEILALTDGIPVSELSDKQIEQLLTQGITPQQIEASLDQESQQQAKIEAAISAGEISEADLKLAQQVEAHTQQLNDLHTQVDSKQSVIDGLIEQKQRGIPLSDSDQQLLKKTHAELATLELRIDQVTEQAQKLYQVAPAAIAWGQPIGATAQTSASVNGQPVAVTDESQFSADNIAKKAAQGAATSSVIDKAQAAIAQNANASQAVTQQVSAQQVTAQQSPTPSNIPSELNLAASANSLASADMATKAASSDAMMAAAGGAAASLSALSRNSAKDDSKESTLAQQISAAAGTAPGTGAPTVGSAPTRAEIQAAQQAPLQLTKELANEQVAEKVQMMMSKNLKNLDIRLDPPELGQMKIRMTMNNDVASVHFTVANGQARDIIEQTLPRLREMLAQQGLQLADSSVHQQSSGQSQQQYNSGDGGQQNAGSGANGTQGDENLDSSSNLELNVASKRDGISYYA